MIRLESVTKEFPNGQVAVADLSLDVDAGELCVVVGPSGCGKTTTMRMINRLIDPTSGRVLLDEEDVANIDPVVLRRRIGYVIQQVGLFPHQTVAENVATVPRLLGWDKRRTKARVNELLDMVGLPPDQFASRYPSQLSGGQRQRVGVARALGADPPVLLMDEPFGAIDPITRARLREEFLRLQRDLRKTVVFVTHDVEEAVKLGDRIAVMADGGVLAQHDTPLRVLTKPASPFVADFVGKVNVLAGTGEGAGLRVGSMLLQCEGARAGSLKAYLRPEDIVARPIAPGDTNVFEARIDKIEFLGSYCLVHVATNGLGQPLTVYLSLNFLSEQSLQPGSSLKLRILPERLRLFDAG